MTGNNFYKTMFATFIQLYPFSAARHIMAFMFSFLVLSFFLPEIAMAQKAGIPVTVHIAGRNGKPLENAVLDQEIPAGHKTINAAKTDKDGNVLLQLQMGTSYTVEISAKDFAPLMVQLKADSAGQVFRYTLDVAQSLQGATVTARKLLMRQEDDKTIVDPEPLAVSSSSGYEVLEKTPGIVADQDGNFYLSATNTATIYINGRELKMSNTDIASMLKSLPPNAIERIEILRTPSAKYDASGAGGIINIVLKKGVKLGISGSVNAGVQQGVYGNQYGGVSLNYNDGDKSAYLNLNYAQRRSMEHVDAYRTITPDTSLDQSSASVYNSHNIYLGYGAGKTAGKWTHSYDGRISGTYNNNRTDNGSVFLDTLGTSFSASNTHTDNDGRSWNIDQSLDTKYKIDTTGSEWTASVNWNGNFGHSTQDIYLRQLQGMASELSDHGDISNTKHYIAAQTDLKYKYRYHLTFETGFKSSATFYHFNSDFTASYNNQLYVDTIRTATYRYHENINAAYFQVAKSINDLIIKPGLRLENTNMVGHQERPGISDFSIHRTDLFPYLYVSKNLFKMFSLDFRGFLIYRRTITRPTYDYLNPFRTFLDPYLYQTGNPSLRPQFTNNYEFNVSVNEFPVFAVGYNDMKDIFAQVTYQDDADKSIAYRTYDNLGRNREFYLRGVAGIPPGGKYFFIVGGEYSVSNYDGYYSGAPLNYKREMWTFYTYHNLKVTKTTNFTLNGYMRLHGLAQFYELEPLGTLNASLSQFFCQKKIQLTVSIQDMFYTNRYNYSIDQGGIEATGQRYNDSRRFGINLRYNFGIRKKEENNNFMDQGKPEKSEGGE
ncbi:outer membrane beta-barrel protein [Chitinophagaceae bacterium MMS25-I14]